MKKLLNLVMVILVATLTTQLAAKGDNQVKSNLDAMILVYDTSLGDGTSITLPLRGEVDVTVDWGDSTTDTFNTDGNYNHSYATEGEYNVLISGNLQGFGGRYQTPFENSYKLTKVISFGDLAIENLAYGFENAKNLTEVPNSIPSTIENLSNTFNSCDSFNQDISSWDVSNVTDMSGLFAYNQSFNQNIDSWDVSNVTDMSEMFLWATSYNQPLDSWDVSSVTNMYYMFTEALLFNQDLNSWNVGNVTNMSKMFGVIRSIEFSEMAFNGDITSWDVSSVTDMSWMFSSATSFNQDISSWDVSSVSNMNRMFLDADSFNQDLNAWDISSVEEMNFIFGETASFNGDISSWNITNIENLTGLFMRAEAFNQDISTWDMSNVKKMEFMLSEATSFDQSLGEWKLDNLESARGLLEEVELSIENYDNTLIEWASDESTPNNITFDAGLSKYSSGAIAARSYLVDTKGWEITDAGLSGTISEDITWSGGVIAIAGDITIEEGATLTIEPGTIVDFKGDYFIDVKGRVVAEGDYDNRIKFDSEHYAGWGGIRFIDNYNELGSIFSKCNFSNVNNSYLFYVANGASIDGINITIVDVVIEENDNELDGIIHINNGTMHLINSVIANNTVSLDGGAIYLENSESKIVNCTIVKNSAEGKGGGIAFVDSETDVYNTIIWNNSAAGTSNQVNIEGTISPNFYNSNIEGGFEGITGSGSGANFSGDFDNNIANNPMFEESKNGYNYSLLPSSPCINSGTIEIENYELPDYDIIGNDRIYPNFVDMGAFELNVSSVDETLVESSALMQNYPNPFNPTTTINYQVTMDSDITLVVYNANGEMVKEVVTGNHKAGSYSVEFDGSNLSSGIYYYSLKGNNFNVTKRMVLLK